MTDYRINLAKELTSTPEQRRKFYHGMLLYLVLCAAVMVYTAYLTSLNVTRALSDGVQRRALVKSVSSADHFTGSFYRNPDATYRELERYAADVEMIRWALARRTRYLPVITGLFSDFPEGVALQSLNANGDGNRVRFSLAVPIALLEQSDPMRTLQDHWRQNESLMKLIEGVRPLTRERSSLGGQAVYVMEFECVLK